MKKKQHLEAGDFKTWQKQTRTAIQNNQATNVPCGSCSACCTSSYFIHIRPDEKKTLDRIPKELLFPAKGLPKGHLVLGFDANGHCPMLKDNKCTIYQDRPLTCRRYDCRVFTASGLPAGDEKKALINQQVESWKFKFSGDDARELYSAIRKTTKFLVENKKKFPKDFIPSNTSQLAILAIKVYPIFEKENGPGNDSQIIKDIIIAVKSWP